MYKINNIQNLKKYNIVFILFITLFPSNLINTLNGLPLTSLFENVFLFIVIPLIFLSSNLLYSKKISFFLLVLSIIKVTFIFSPENGIGHQMFFEKYNNKTYIKTYSSFWNKKYSSVQKKSWNRKENFPIDWLSSTDKKNNSDNLYYYYSKKDFDNINLKFISRFQLLNDKKLFLKLNLASEDIEYIKIKDENFDTKKYLKENKVLLSKGFNEIEIKFVLKKTNFSFNPHVSYLDQTKSISILKNKLAYLPDEKLNSYKVEFFKNLSSIFDILIFSLLVFIILSILLDIKKKYFNYYPLLIIIIFLNVFYFLIDTFIQNEKILLFQLNLSYSLSILSFLILYLLFFKNSNWIKNFFLNINFNYFICFIIPLIVIGIFNNFDEIEALSWWVPGDDGHTYQKFAREVVVENQWLHPNVIYRQAPMYLFGIFHIIFGQSGFSQKIIEFYLVILTCLFVYKIILNITYHKNLGFIFSLVLLICFTGEKYTSFIGKGYTEFYAAFLIVFSVFLLQQFEKSLLLFIFLFFISVVGLGLREDHIFIIFAIIFFSKSFYIRETEYKSSYEKFFKVFSKNFKTIIFFGFLILLSFAIIMVRNFYATEDISTIQNIFKIVIPAYDKIFDLFLHDPISLVETKETNVYIDETFKHAYYRMFFGATPWDTPRITSIFLIPGFIISLLSIVLIHKMKHISLGSIISIFAILFPYLFILNHGYEPRYTIHYLPFCLIIIAEFINLLSKNNKLGFFSRFI